MAKYFPNVPLPVIGVAKIVRDFAITMTGVSIVEYSNEVVFTFMFIREIVGGFVKYAEEEPPSLPVPTSSNIKPKPDEL